MQFGGDSTTNKAVIKRIADALGKMRAVPFDGGFFASISVYFEKKPTGQLLFKLGSFNYDFDASGALDLSSASFPSDEVVPICAAPNNFNYYPVGTEFANGPQPMELNTWLKIDISYNELSGLHLITINGKEYLRRQRYRGGERLKQDSTRGFEVLAGNANYRLRNVSLSYGPVAGTENVRVSVQNLAYQDSTLISLDRFALNVAFPCTLQLFYESHSGGKTPMQTFVIPKRVDKFVKVIKSPVNRRTTQTVKVELWKDLTCYHSEYHQFTNPAVRKKANASRITVDNIFQKNGSKFFPRILYHVAPAQMDTAKKVGANVVTNDFTVNNMGGSPIVNTQRSLDSAQANGLFLTLAINTSAGKKEYVQFINHAALWAIYLRDEPSGEALKKAIETDVIATRALIDTNECPIFLVQNNFNRLYDCAAVDFLGTDPYPVPCVALRMIDDATKAAVAAVAGKKPVITVIPQYPGKIPTLAEFRAMAWLAVTAGASGVAVFEFDHRQPAVVPPTVESTWYTPNNASAYTNLDTVFHDLARYESILICKKSPLQISETNKAVHTFIKVADDGTRYLIVANDTRQTQTMKCKIPGLTGSANLTPLNWNGADLPVVSGTATITLSGLQYSLFRL